MAQVEIYTSFFCGYCASAKELLTKKGIDFAEVDVTSGGSKKAEMIRRAGGRTTVPQIFIDGEHIGGCDDLHALDRAGELDAKLAR